MRMARVTGWAVGILAVTAVLAAPLVAQQDRGGRGGQGGQGGRPGGLQGGLQGLGNFGQMGGNLGGFQLLMNPQVQEELGLMGGQVEELRQLQRDMMASLRDSIGGRGDGDRGRNRIEQLVQESERLINSVLLPHQQTRFNQIQNQLQTQGGRPGAGLARNQRLLEELNVTPEQRRQLQEAAAEAQRELDEKIAALRREAESKVLQVLSPEQRRQYQQLVGEPFELDRARALRPQQDGDRGARGQRGDRGGDDRAGVRGQGRGIQPPQRGDRGGDRPGRGQIDR